MKKLLILDRDGVINQDSYDYIKSCDEFIPIEGSFEAMARLSQAGFKIGIATNQSGIARGLYTEETLKAIHFKMLALAEAAGASIHAIEYCPHMPEAGCACRKPAPGMLEALGRKLGVESLEAVPFVGDRVTDIEAAYASSAIPYLVQSTMTDMHALRKYPEVPVFSSLSAWVDFWLDHSSCKV